MLICLWWTGLFVLSADIYCPWSDETWKMVTNKSKLKDGYFLKENMQEYSSGFVLFSRNLWRMMQQVSNSFFAFHLN